jgi:hypothetical protein
LVFGLILADVEDVIEDQQMIFVEFGKRGFESEFAPRDRQDEIAGAHEQHAPSVLDERDVIEVNIETVARREGTL